MLFVRSRKRVGWGQTELRISSWQIQEKQEDLLWKVLVLRYKLQRKLSRVDKMVKILLRAEACLPLNHPPDAKNIYVSLAYRL